MAFKSLFLESLLKSGMNTVDEEHFFYQNYLDLVVLVRGKVVLNVVLDAFLERIEIFVVAD